MKLRITAVACAFSISTFLVPAWATPDPYSQFEDFAAVLDELGLEENATSIRDAVTSTNPNDIADLYSDMDLAPILKALRIVVDSEQIFDSITTVNSLELATAGTEVGPISGNTNLQGASRQRNRETTCSLTPTLAKLVKAELPDDESPSADAGCDAGEYCKITSGSTTGTCQTWPAANYPEFTNARSCLYWKGGPLESDAKVQYRIPASVIIPLVQDLTIARDSLQGASIAIKAGRAVYSLAKRPCRQVVGVIVLGEGAVLNTALACVPASAVLAGLEAAVGLATALVDTALQLVASEANCNTAVDRAEIASTYLQADFLNQEADRLETEAKEINRDLGQILSLLLQADMARGGPDRLNASYRPEAQDEYRSIIEADLPLECSTDDDCPTLSDENPPPYRCVTSNKTSGTGRCELTTLPNCFLAQRAIDQTKTQYCVDPRAQASVDLANEILKSSRPDRKRAVDLCRYAYQHATAKSGTLISSKPPLVGCQR